MTELLTDNKVEEKPLVKCFSKRSVHNATGICFDKKDTYTISEEVSKFGCHKPFTVNTILSLAGVKPTSNKTTVIVARLIDNDSYYRERNIIKYQYVYLVIDTDKKVEDYWGDDCYGKGATMDKLRECYCAIVIQADDNSLQIPNLKRVNDIDDYYQDIFNYKDTNKRIVFDKNYSYGWSDEERKLYTYDEMMSMPSKNELKVRFKDNGVKFDCKKTWYKMNDDTTWADFIDKSGYNKAKAIWNLETRLAEYKAEKIRKNIVSGKSELLNLMTKLETSITECHSLIKQEFCKAELDDTNRFCTSWNGYVSVLKSIRDRKNTLQTYLNNIGTENERTYQTLDIENDINETMTRLNKLVEAINNKEEYKR